MDSQEPGKIDLDPKFLVDALRMKVSQLVQEVTLCEAALNQQNELIQHLSDENAKLSAQTVPPSSNGVIRSAKATEAPRE